ncbi:MULTISPECIES: hypothetical protein [unclassified Streptomyces]|uniref:hypothetical protein n=1 Tax=unclassified Streptomyces TaxID=2593676 RepID=UPI002365BB8E|nr:MULTISPECIES: hypothetical protein [unclassified Streptomyces]MDF3148397.1 hypothetical protein [Streptomyces sp. T21Q-yed]WDF40921.1 hypothetical protein PBV52_31155 [Streptomyces sp. T12]
MSETDEAPAASGRLRRALPHSRRGRLSLISALVLALAGTGLGTWAADTWPWPKDRYCWGAWEEDSGPEFLGDAAFGDDDDGSRTGTETAPTRERPTGSCEVAIASDYKSSYDGDKVSIRQQVSVEYGPVPKAAEARLAMVQDDFLGGDMVPLPDGLPGTVNGRGGLLVLPKACDTQDGRPTVVTMRASGMYTSGPSYSQNDPAGLGGAREAAVLLVAAANRGMAAAGCAPDEPLRVSSPVYDLPGNPERIFSTSDDACGIRGLRLGMEDIADQTGAVTRDLQTCSVRGDGVPYLELAMVAQPRLAAVFDGIPGERPAAPGWRGTGTIGENHAIVRADCAGRPTTFLMGASTDPGYLATFTNAAAARLGCAPIAPKGAAR